jgi:cysteine protease ATG4
MLLATALHHHLLGRDWRLSSSDTRGHAIHRQILSWFGDFPSPLCPFSIHRLMEAAVSYNNKPGDWFGPSQVSLLIRDCIKRAIREHVNLQKLNIYVAYDCTGITIMNIERYGGGMVSI